MTQPQATQPVQQTTQAPRVVKPRDTQNDIQCLTVELEGWVAAYKRSVAGFNSLNGSLQSAMGQTPEGERKKGLPIFEFSAALESSDSREVVKCVADLKKVDPNYIQHVLVPLINAQAVGLLESLDEISMRIDLLRPLIQRVTEPHAATTAG